MYRIWKGIGLSLVMVLLAAASLKAQDTTAQLPAQWTLQQCIDYARRNNISLNTLRLDQSSAGEDLAQSKAAKLPSLSGSASQSLVNSKNTDPVVGGFQTQASFSSSYGLSSNVVLYQGGYLNLDIKEKDLLVKSANLSVEETANDITLQITQAFLNILLAKENIVSLEDVLATSQAQLAQAQQLFDAGSLSRKDFLTFQSQVASDQYNLVQAQNNNRQNVISLKQLLQLPSTAAFDAEVPDTVIVREAAPSLEAAQEAAVSTRPEVENSKLSVELAEVALSKARTGYLPTVSLGGSLSTGYSDNQTSKYVSQLNDNFYQRLGLTVAVPIFSNRSNKTNVAKSKIQIEQARLSLLNTKTTLEQAVEQAYVNMINAQAQYTAAETQLNASKESYDITNEQLKLGSVNTVDLQQQKNQYIQALQAYTQAKYTAVLYMKIYNFYTGAAITLD